MLALRILMVGMCLTAACSSVLGIDDFNGPNDGDAAIDAPSGPPQKPAPRAPRLGATTGSVHVTSSLRPTFSWRPVSTATRYELVVDDSCQVTSFRNCLFPNPEIMETSLTATSFSPPGILNVNLSPPVGRRYYWRVRACNDDGCSDWSDVWYLDVGRLADDVNGDGYGDLIIGIHSAAGSTTEVGAAHIAFGRPATTGSVTLTKLTDPRGAGVTDTRFGSAVAMVGDVNADGYGDVLVGAWRADNTSYTGNAYLFLGRGTWPATVGMATCTFGLSPGDPSTAFGGAVAGRGDVNGDGFGDVAITAVPPLSNPGQGIANRPGYVHVNFGRATWSFSQLGSDVVIPDALGEMTGYFGAGLALDDVNEDGLGDVVVGAPGRSSAKGGTAVYYGLASYPPAPHTVGSPDVDLPSPSQGLAVFGASVASCVSTGTRPAVAVGAPADSIPAAQAGVTRLYAVAEPWPTTVATPDRTFPEPAGALNGNMGFAVTCGDVTGDGNDDLVVGSPTGDDRGNVYVFDNAGALPNAHLVALTSGSGSFGRIGMSVAVTDFDGDGVADVFAGAPNLSTFSVGQVLGWTGRAVWPSSIATPDIVIDNPSGNMNEYFGRWLD